MSNLLRGASCALLCFLLSTASYGQKYGHVNFGNLLESMAEVKAIDAKLATFQDSLSNILGAAGKSLQLDMQNAQKRYEAGELSANDAGKIQTDLGNRQQGLLQTEQLYNEAIVQKRQTYLAPLLNNVGSVIESYAKENGYTMIFDESAGVLLYDDPSNDLTEIIKQKL